MKNKSFIVCMIILVFINSFSSVSAAQIFFDGFESGNLNGWEVTQSSSAWYANNTGIIGDGSPIESWEMISSNSGTTAVYSQKNISTIGYNDIILIFYYKTDTNLLDSGEYFTAEWYDGSIWNVIFNLTGDISTSYVLSSDALNSLANNNLNFKIRFSCKSNQGTEGCAIDNVTIIGTAIPDSTLPSITIIYPQNTSYNLNISSLNYTASDDIALDKCWYSLNLGVTNTTITCGTNITELTSNEGSNIWRVYVNDTNGNLNWTDITFFKDTVKPQIQIAYPPNNTNTTNIQLNINYTRSDLNLGGCWWTNDSGIHNFTINECANITGQIWNEGLNTIIVYVNDSVGNVNSSSVRFRIDTTGPTISIIYPESKTYGYNISLPLNYSVSDLTGVISCWYNLNNGNNITISNCQNTTFNASDGNYVIYFYANDSLGNLANSNRSFSVSTTLAVDLIKPEYNAWLNYNNIEFNYTVNTASYIKNCSLWGNWTGNWHLNQTNLSFVNSSGGTNRFLVNLSDGSYIWNIFCSNTYNAFAFNNYTLNIDSINPALDIQYPINNTLFRQNISIPINFTINDANLQSCWYSLDNGNTNKTINCNNGFNNLSFGYKNGSYNLSVYANDSAGNAAISIIYNISVEYDSIAPNLTLTEPTGTKTSRTGIPIQFSVSDNVDLINELECSFNVLRGASIEVGNTSIICSAGSGSFDVSGDGTYIFNFYVEDISGNINYTSFNFSVSTSSSVTPPSGGGGSGGGGGGGSGGGIIIKKTGQLQLYGLRNIVAREEDKKSLSLNVKNIGKIFLNNCRLLITGEVSSWFYSSQIDGIAPGENKNFVFDLNVPEGIEQRDYSGKLKVECDEVSGSSSFVVSIPKNSAGIEIKQIKQEKNNLKINYFINSEIETSIDIWLIDKKENEIKKIKDNGKGERTVVMELNEGLVGIYSIYFAPSSNLDNFIKQSVVLGKSSETGFTILNQPGNKMIGYIIFVLIIFIAVFFIARSKNEELHKTKHKVLFGKKEF